MSRIIAVFSLLLLLAVPATSGSAAIIPVTVSIPPQKFFVERIGGPHVAVTVMAGQGKDPHSYEPTAAQMAAVSKTALYLTIGVPFESQWLPRFRGLNPSMKVVSLMDGIERLAGGPDLALRPQRAASSSAAKGSRRDEADKHGHRHGHERQAAIKGGSGQHHGHEHEDHGHDGHGHHHGHGLEGDDPHVWLSPRTMRATVAPVRDALCRELPGECPEFTRQAAELEAEIDKLDAELAALFAPLPAERRLFMTFHQSWAYFAANYALREVSVELDGREPSPKGMARLVEFAAANTIRVLVVDPMTSQSASRAIARNIKAVIVTARPLDEDWAGALRGFSAELAGALAR